METKVASVSEGLTVENLFNQIASTGKSVELILPYKSSNLSKERIQNIAFVEGSETKAILEVMF